MQFAKFDCNNDGYHNDPCDREYGDYVSAMGNYFERKVSQGGGGARTNSDRTAQTALLYKRLRPSLICLRVCMAHCLRPQLEFSALSQYYLGYYNAHPSAIATISASASPQTFSLAPADAFS